MKNVQFTRSYTGYRANTVAQFEDHIADKLVFMGIAVEYRGKPKVDGTSVEPARKITKNKIITK